MPSQNNNSQKPEGSFAKETRKTLETCAKIDQAEDDLRDTRIFHSGAMDLETHLRLAFRRFTDQEYLQALSETYPELVSMSADLQSQIDDILRTQQ